MFDTHGTDGRHPGAGANRFDSLDADGVLASLTEVVQGRERLEVDKLELALVWADMHATVIEFTDAGGRRIHGVEELVQLAGDGTPEVAEFAVAEFACVAGTSTMGGAYLIGDALELRHRLPRIWAQVQAGECTVARAREVARQTRPRSQEVAAFVDERLETVLGRQTHRSAQTLAAAAVIAADPDAATDREKRRRGERGVFAHRADPELDEDAATRGATIRAGVRDMTWFLAGIDRMATAMKLLGDTRGEDERRAAASGILADPAKALEVYRRVAEMSATTQPGRPAEPDEPVDPTDSADPTPAPRPSGPSSGGCTCGGGGGGVRWQTLLYIHTTLEQLRSGQGVARIEDQGPVSVATMIDVLTAGAGQGVAPRIVVKPVIDLNDGTGVESYEIPDRIREIVHLRNPRDYFPYGSCTSRSMDLDHIEAWKPDPPPDGEPQTRPDNLAPLTRKHHRIKTHSGWSATQIEPGIVLWRSPHGYAFLVDHTGTRPLGRPPGSG